MQSPYHLCLLIDDNALDNFINYKILKRNHFADEIIISQSPEHALSLIEKGTVKPDVIFLDINMPNMDGFQFLNAYDKIDSDKLHTKIFILSSSINPLDIRRAENNKYVSRYITKSLTPEILSELAE